MKLLGNTDPIVTAPAKQVPSRKAVPKVTPTVSDVSQNGLLFIARNEGCVLHPYNDGGGSKGNATIGVGHLIHMGPFTEQDVERYKDFTQAEADALLHTDAAQVVYAVRALPAHLTQPQFDALVDLGFNCGAGALTGNITAGLRESDIALVTSTILEYVHAGGVVLPGLVARREREVALFLHGTYS